jgi:hypothetical protein
LFRYCNCSGVPESLLHCGIWPATAVEPNLGFTLIWDVIAGKQAYFASKEKKTFKSFIIKLSFQTRVHAWICIE